MLRLHLCPHETPGRAEKDFLGHGLDLALAGSRGNLNFYDTFPFCHWSAQSVVACSLVGRGSHVDWIEAEGNYVGLHVGNHDYEFRETRAALEEKLDAF